MIPSGRVWILSQEHARPDLRPRRALVPVYGALFVIMAVFFAGCSSAPETAATVPPTTLPPADTGTVPPATETTAAEAPAATGATVSPAGTGTANLTATPATTEATPVPTTPAVTTVATMAEIPVRTIPEIPVIGTWGYENDEGKAVTMTFETGGRYSGTLDNEPSLPGSWREAGENHFVVTLSSGEILTFFYDPEGDTLDSGTDSGNLIVRV